MPNPQRLTEALRAAVRASGVSQEQVCREIDLDRAALSRFMNGKAGLWLSTLERLADYLDLELRPRRRARKAKP